MAKDNFAASLIEDYVDLGFGERISPTELRSFDGETVLALESSSGDSLSVYSNSDLIATLDYKDNSFTEKLLGYVTFVLNL